LGYFYSWGIQLSEESNGKREGQLFLFLLYLRLVREKEMTLASDKDNSFIGQFYQRMGHMAQSHGKGREEGGSPLKRGPFFFPFHPMRINIIGTAGVVNTSVLGVKSYDYRKIN